MLSLRIDCPLGFASHVSSVKFGSVNGRERGSAASGPGACALSLCRPRREGVRPRGVSRPRPQGRRPRQHSRLWGRGLPPSCAPTSHPSTCPPSSQPSSPSLVSLTVCLSSQLHLRTNSLPLQPCEAAAGSTLSVPLSSPERERGRKPPGNGAFAGDEGQARPPPGRNGCETVGSETWSPSCLLDGNRMAGPHGWTAWASGDWPAPLSWNDLHGSPPQPVARGAVGAWRRLCHTRHAHRGV